MVTKEQERKGFAERLNMALDAAGVAPKGHGRQGEVASMFNVSQKGARKWLEGEGMPDTTRIPKIADKLKVRAEWLLTGQGQMRAGQDDLNPQEEWNYGPIEPGREYIPIRKVKIKPSAGITGYAIDFPEEDGKPIFFRADWLQEKRYRPDRLVALVVSGRSMEPSLYDGDLIIINLDDTTPKEGEVYVLNMEGEIVVKRLRRERGQWIVASDNPDKRHYPDKPIDGEHAKIIGRVVYLQTEHI